MVEALRFSDVSAGSVRVAPAVGDDHSGGWARSISVVTPTFGQPKLVTAVLESCVVAGRNAGVEWEHVVVDSTPDPQQAQQIAASCAHYGARYLRKVAAVGPKRSEGVRLTRYPVVLFVDSDCRADPQLFVEHLRAHDGVVGAVAGPTRMEGADDSFVWRVIRRAKQYNHCYAWPDRYSQLGWSTTSNLSVRAEVFAQVGGFDEHPYTIQGGDDVDLGVRISKAGHRIISNRNAIVFHSRAPMTRVHQVGRRVFTYGKADGWLCAKHPDLASWYANPFVVSAAVGTAALAMRGRWRWLPAAAGPATLGFQVAREVLVRHERGAGLAGVARDLLCTAVDLCFDAGEVVAAIQLRRPAGALRRFQYVQPAWFVSHQQQASDDRARAG